MSIWNARAAAGTLLRRQGLTTALAAVATGAILAGSGGAATAAPPPPAAATVRLSVPGFTTSGAAPKVTVRPGTQVTAADIAAASQVIQCYLNGQLPTLSSAGLLDGIVYFSASFGCNDTVWPGSSVEIAVALEQESILGGWERVKSDSLAGPYPGPVGLGISETLACASINVGDWRGAARPRIITPAVIYEWEWFYTYPTRLTC